MLRERYTIRNQGLEAALEKMRASGIKNFSEGKAEDFETAATDGLFLVRVTTMGYPSIVA